MVRKVIAFTFFLLACFSIAQAQQKAQDLDIAAIRFEQNATDRDVEVVFEVEGGEAGLNALQVLAPDGRMVIDFKAPASKLGIRQVTLESPEPANDGTIQADYPEGEYTFSATTVDGMALRGKAVLSHELPPAASFIQPRANGTGVPVTGLQVRWNSARNMDAHILVLEQEDTGFKMTAHLPGGARRFRVPDGLLQPNTAYKLEIGTVSRRGNITYVETTFRTAANKSAP